MILQILLLLLVVTLLALAVTLLQRTTRIMSALDHLKAAIAAETTILGQAVTILDSIPGLIAAAQTGGNTDADLEALTAEITSQTASLKDAIVASGQGAAPAPPAPASLTIDTSAVSPGQVGASYSAPLSASGGTEPYSFSVSGLPDGLSFDSATTTIVGTPASAGTFSLSVSVIDSSSPALSAGDSVTLVIDKAP